MLLLCNKTKDTNSWVQGYASIYALEPLMGAGADAPRGFRGGSRHGSPSPPTVRSSYGFILSLKAAENGRKCSSQARSPLFSRLFAALPCPSRPWKHMLEPRNGCRAAVFLVFRVVEVVLGGFQALGPTVDGPVSLQELQGTAAQLL